MKNTKQILAVLLALVLLLSCAPLAFAEDAPVSGTAGALTWTLDSDGTLTISGTGRMSNYIYDLVDGFSNVPWGQYYSRIKTVVIGDSVTSIGDYAFRDCSSLTSVTIGDSVTSIGDHAFYFCSSLTSVTIPDSVTSIGSDAFEYCSSLTSVTIPDSVTSIGYPAFFGCSSLKKIFITDLAAWVSISGLGNLMSYGSNQKELYLNGELLKEAVIPDSVTSIPSYAFSGCSSLTSVTIPDSVTYIGRYAFSGCDALQDVYYDGSVIEFLLIDIEDGNLPLKKANIHFHEHEIAEVTDVTPATCTQPGVKTGVCACGQTLTEEIPALGHSYLTTVTPATCTTVGYTICKCERCDHQYVSDFENALGHADADANGNCTRCGVHLKDAAPTTEPTTQPATDPQPEPQDVCPWCGGQHEGFFQGIVAWFHSLLAGIFGAKY